MAASISFNGKDLIHKIDILQQRQIPFIAALTISGRKAGDVSLASEVKKDLEFEMKDSFNQVSPQTKWLFDKPKARKNSLKTVIYHKEGLVDSLSGGSAKGQAPADYLKPQIVGGRVLETGFQKRLKRKGYIKNSGYMLPLHDQPFRKVRGRLAPSVYAQALWGISAMEELRNTNIASKYPKKDFKTKGTFVHVPKNLAKDSDLGGMDIKRYAQNIRALAYKKGQPWHSLPGPGIYKVNAKGRGLTRVFRELDRVPTIDGPTYLFKETATKSVMKNAQRIFDMKVKEVLGS